MIARFGSLSRFGKIGAVAALLAALAAPAAAQFGGNTLTVNSAASGSSPSIRAEGLDANINIDVVPKGTGILNLGAAGLTATGTVTLGPTTASSLTLSSAGTTKFKFLPAITHCRANSANVVVARLAAGDWVLTRTAAGAEVYIIICQVDLQGFIGAASKGVRVNSFKIAQQITVAALTAATFTQFSKVDYADNVANAVAAYAAPTITMPTATQANPYLTAGTLTTPPFVTTQDSQLNIEYTITMQNTGVYRLYGISLNYTEAAF